MVTYVILCGMVYGDPLGPVTRVMFGWVHLPGFVIMTSVIGGLSVAVCAIAFTRKRFTRLINLEPVILITVLVMAPVLIASFQTHVIQRAKIAELNPDKIFTRSFILSLRNTPSEFQFYLHAAAVKDCIPYAWSYRQLEFYRLSNNVAVNVLPSRWVENCQISRT